MEFGLHREMKLLLYSITFRSRCMYHSKALCVSVYMYSTITFESLQLHLIAIILEISLRIIVFLGMFGSCEDMKQIGISVVLCVQGNIDFNLYDHWLRTKLMLYARLSKSPYLPKKKAPFNRPKKRTTISLLNCHNQGTKTKPKERSYLLEN